MERKLETNLHPDEKLLWFGRPTPSKLMRAPDKTIQVILWMVSMAVAGVTLGVFLPYALNAGIGTDVIVIMLLLLNFIPLALAVRPFLDKKVLEKNTVYAVTDQRVIAVVKNTVLSLPREGLRWDVTSRDGASGNLCFNTAISASPVRSRAQAVMGVKSDGEKVDGIIFYHIQDPEGVMEAMA